MRLVIVASKPTDAVTHGFLPAARRLDLEVLLLTDRPAATERALAASAGYQVRAGDGPRIVACDVHDPSALIGVIGGRPRADAVFSNSDRLQTQTALAAEYFGLPGKDWRSCLRGKNKPLMRGRLAGTGVEKVTAVEITAHDAVPPDLPYPPVLKPAEGVASEDVVVAERSGVLAAAPEAQSGPGAGYWPMREPGERIIVTRSNRDYLGVITATGPEPAAAERAVAAFRAPNRWEITS